MITPAEKLAAFAQERNSWIKNKAYIRVDRSSVPSDANTIGSHIIYSRKDDGTPKARIVPWGHRDRERNDLGTDSPCLNLEMFRIVLSVAAEHSWILGQMDIKTAYLQACGFQRDLYVKPPK